MGNSREDAEKAFVKSRQVPVDYLQQRNERQNSSVDSSWPQSEF
jgi:hypothetical protein